MKEEEKRFKKKMDDIKNDIGIPLTRKLEMMKNLTT